jgi:hypothetical protein
VLGAVELDQVAARNVVRYYHEGGIPFLRSRSEGLLHRAARNSIMLAEAYTARFPVLQQIKNRFPWLRNVARKLAG